jgi:hypothetical protein
MSKFKILLLMFFITIVFMGCVASEEDITFELNPGIDMVEVNSDYQDPGATAKVFGLGRKVNVIENTVDISQLGTYYIKYEFTYQETTKTLYRIVTVIDETNPEISINPGIDTVKINHEWIDASFTVTDNSDQPVQTETIGEVDTTKSGTYTITYIAIDSSGNQTTAKRIVHIID